MKKIQICYDPLSVIPSDVNYVEEQLEELSENISFIELFDEEEVVDDLPVIYVSNLNLFKAELIDSDKMIIEAKHLDLVEESARTIERLLNEK